MDQTKATETAQQVTDAGMQIVTEWGPTVVAAVALLIVGRMVAGLMRRTVVQGLTRARIDEALHPFVSGMVYYVVIIVVGIAVLGMFGIQMGRLDKTVTLRSVVTAISAIVWSRSAAVFPAPLLGSRAHKIARLAIHDPRKAG